MKAFLSCLALLVLLAQGSQGECNFEASTGRRFAYDLYAKTVADGASNGNVFLAPTTVSAALTLVLAGANGTTREQITRGLKLGSTFPEDELPCLMRLGNDATTKNGDNQALVLRTATRIFGEKSFSFSRSYLNQTENLGSRIKQLNFSGDPDVSRKRINGWVSKITNKKIENLFPEESITSDTILAIASAIYFKGFWVTPFNEKGTSSFDFHVNSNKSVEANFMFNYATFRSSYSYDLKAQLLDLPYKGNGRQEVSMIVILPDEESSITELEAKMTEELVAPAITELSSSRPFRMEVRLPKFKISSNYRLKPILKRMGITDMFSPDLADLSGMISRKSSYNQPLFVSSAIHKTFIEVDEKGTEAAGATGLTLIAMSIPPRFICDRPFIVMIYEKQSQNILFIGKIIDPTQE